MSTQDDKFTIAYHINVTEIVPELGAARFVFRSKVAGRDEEPVNTDIPVFIPYQVLESLANGLPQILADMRAAGCDQLYGSRPQKPNA